MIKGSTVVIKELRHTSALYKMIGSTVTDGALVDAIKNPTSILKKSFLILIEKFKEPLKFIHVFKH